MNPNLPDSFDGMIERKFLAKEDFPDPQILTIERFKTENVAMDDKPEENKWIMFFTGIEKGLVLNSTNIQILKAAFGSPQNSIGQRVQVYVDQNVSFAGKLVGGLRLRGPSRKAAPAPSPAPISQPSTIDDFADDIPF